MPSASTVKVAKEASTEAVEPLKQALVIIEHKIRNLEKRKGRLDGYRDLQKNGKELHNEQLLAVAKYDEVIQTLEFSRDLYKQFLSISTECTKQQKKQARKEALEKTQQEIAKFKEILVIQDVLANMGQDNVREDFLAGRNGALTLTEEDLQRLDDVFVEVSPKREIEEGMPPFSEQAQKAAEHLVNLVDGKNKDFVGTTYAKLMEQISAISACGYFDQSAAGGTPAVAEEVAVVIEASAPPEEEVEPEEVDTQVVQSATFQSMSVVDVSHVVEASPAVMPVVETAGQYMTQLPITDVISSVMSSVTGSLNFIQESELEAPEVAVGVAQVPAQPVTIPTQTFTNANFSAPVMPTAQPPYPHQHQAPAGYAPIPMPPSQQPPPPPQLPQQQQPPPQQHIQQSAPPQPQPTQQQVAYNNQPPAQTFQSQPQQQPQQQITNQYTPTQQPPAQQYSSQSFQHTVDSHDWADSTDQNSDWNIPVEQTTTTTTDSWVDQTESEWNEQTNDGFVQAGSRGGGGRLGRGGGNRNDRGGRGGRDGGYSGQRSNRGNYNNQNGRGGGGGGGGNYYRNNNEGGGNYYQNGFQSGGYKRTGGNRGGAGGAPRQDRGGPRGGGRGGSNNPRGNRGNRQ